MYVFISSKPHKKKTNNTSVIDPNTKLVVVYYNGRKTTLYVHVLEWCQFIRVEGLAESNQPSNQPQRHKKGEWCWVLTSIDRFTLQSTIEPSEA